VCVYFTIAYHHFPCTVLKNKETVLKNVYFLFIYLHRILVQHMPEFKYQAKDVVWHIPHQYTQQMAQNSAVVSFNAIVLQVPPPL